MTNRANTLIVIVLLAVWLFFAGSSSTVTAQGGGDSGLRLLDSTRQTAILELTTGPLQSETVTLEGQTYQRVSLPDLALTDTPGLPQLPLHGAWLGLDSPTGVTVTILEADWETLSGYRLPPAPTPEFSGDQLADLPTALSERYAPDPVVYGRDAFYPAQPVAIEATGYLRDQAAAQVQFYPVQTNPVSGELRVYRRLRVEVRWEATSSKSAAVQSASGPAFEPVLQGSLLNYATLTRPSVEASRSASTPLEPNLSAAAAPPALKIGVTETGLYQLTYADLTGAGFGLSGVDPRNLSLSQGGQEVPILISGESDGVFQSGDTLLFYGLSFEDVYTDQNVYWLTRGSSPGRRLTTRNVSPGGGTTPAHFPATLHLEEDTNYWQTMPNGGSQDRWFWGEKLTAPASRDITFTLQNLSTSAGATALRVRLKGRTADPAVNPDHHTQLYLNGVKLTGSDQTWDDQIIFDYSLSLSPTSLPEGENTLRLQLVGDTGAAADQVFLNWIELDYWDRYVAENDQLVFGAPTAGNHKFKVTGFSHSDLELFDVTDPANIALLTNPTIVSSGGGYTLQFSDAAQTDSRYLALSRAQRRSPAWLELDQSSAWRSPDHGADYIIITHRDFYDAVQPLAAHRQATGLRVVTVKVEDLYDEFNAGLFNPQAIRDFLAHAYKHWTPPAPTYVLLVGDAFQDYKDDLKTGTPNYVPSQLVDTDILGQTPSDTWFVQLSGNDLLPEMLIGRLSVQSAAQAETQVAKIIAYEQTSPVDRPRQALLVADDDSSTFESNAEQLAANFPANYTLQRVYAANYPPGTPASSIITAINTGQSYVHYVGHGSVNRWGHWQNSYIFQNDDVDSLTNSNRLPVVTVANCLSGFFTGSQTQISLAEALTRRNGGGAVAVWAPTAYNYPSGHQALMTAFYKAIFQQKQQALGQAALTAKLAVAGQNSTWDELIETFVLFGDPATPVNAAPTGPTDPPLNVYLPLVIKHGNTN